VDYGTYMLLWGLCELAVPLTSLGMLQAVQQFLPRLASQGTVGDTRRFVRVMESARWALMLLAGAGIAWVWPALAIWLQAAPSTLELGTLVGSLLVFSLGSRFVAELLESLLEQRDAQWVRALQPLTRALGLLALWQFGQVSLIALLWVDVVVCAATLVLGQWMLSRRLRALRPNGLHQLDWSEVRGFVGHMSLSQLLTAAGDPGAVRLVLARTLGVEAAGVFAFVQQLVMMINRYLPSLLLANVVRPMLVARHQEGDLSTVGTGIALLWKLNLTLLLGALGVVAVGGDDLLSVAGLLPTRAGSLR
jgi:hypothetical protein